jgi:hypothetical protein
MTRDSRVRNAVLSGLLAGVVTLVAGPAAAIGPVLMGGVDAQSSYEGFLDAQPNAGVFTFFDAAVETTPAKGFMTTPPVGFPAFIGATIDLELIFDTSVCLPSACAIQNAEFKGANAGADMMIWPSGGGPIPLLALDVVRIEVVQASPTSGGLIALGGQVVNPGPSLFATSELTILGGSEAAAIIAAAGGNKAILRIDIDKPKDKSGSGIVIGDLFGTGDWFNDDFTVGLPSITPVGGTNFDLVIVPEPGTAALFGLSLLGLALRRRKR